MPSVKVDTDLLAKGLTEGFLASPRRDTYIPNYGLLRYSICGLMSTAVMVGAARSGVPASLKISEPELPQLDRTEQARHVFVVVGEGDTERVIDPTFGQFLGLVSLRPRLEELTGTKLFPDEEVISFLRSDVNEMTSWLAGFAAHFQSRHAKQLDTYKNAYRGGYLYGSPEPVIADVYRKIWDIDAATSWTPPDYILTMGEQIADHIPGPAITISSD